MESQQLLHAFKELKDALHDLANHLTTLSGYQGYLVPTEHFALTCDQLSVPPTASAYKLAIAAYLALCHQGQEPGKESRGDGRRTLQLPGLIAADATAIDLAKRANKLRSSLQICVDAVVAANNWGKKTWPREVRQIFSSAGYGRISLKHCYRNIPLVPVAPDSINLSWLKQRRTIKPITPQDCEKRLRALDPALEAVHLRKQYEALAELGPSERGNLRFVQTYNRHQVQFGYRLGGTYHDIGVCNLPVLVPTDNGLLPKFQQLDLDRLDKPRKPRNDRKLQDTPFMPSISVYLVAAE